MHVAHFIRPILRGRDIKRYKYNFADKWLIATFPAKHYNIDNYPAVRDYLLTFEIEKLEQSGKKDLNGVKGNNARKKTNNKWFETQDSIAYWDDFNKQKIIYPETTQGAYFVLDDEKYFVDKTCFFITGKNLKYVYSILSSKLFEYAYKKIFSAIKLGKSGYQYNKHALVQLPVKKVSDNRIFSDDEIFNIYELTSEEIELISSASKLNDL